MANRRGPGGTAHVAGTEPIMSQDIDQSRGRNPRRRRLVTGLMATLLFLSGCTAVPDWADPADWFTIDPVPTKVGLAEGQARSQPTGFPNLASVPNQPPEVLSVEARAVLQADLAADRDNAVFSDQTPSGSAPIRANSGPSAASGTNDATVLPGAPVAPRIGRDLTASIGIPPAPARTPVVQPEPVPAPVQPLAALPQATRASGEPAKSRFPEAQEHSPPGVTALPAAAGGQLVAVIYFGQGSSQLDGKDRAVLRDVATLHRQRGGIIRVVGYASAQTVAADRPGTRIGRDPASSGMSLKRANSVATGLIALGADRGRVRAEAGGGNQPAGLDVTVTGEAGNRRAEIFLEN